MKKIPGSFNLIPIGVIHSPFQTHDDAPRQGRLSDAESTIDISDPFTEGLRDVEYPKNLIVLYWLDRADRNRLTAIPPGTSTEHGVFATRSPNRPNPVGFAVVNLIRRNGNRLIVKGLDALDGTPVLDIKPYSAEIDCVKA